MQKRGRQTVVGAVVTEGRKGARALGGLRKLGSVALAFLAIALAGRSLALTAQEHAGARSGAQAAR
jgi:hypothetical protein